jgi:hypothetical protein
MYVYVFCVALYGLRVEIATGYALDGRGSNPGRDIGPDRLSGPTSLLFNGYRGIFP